MGLKIYIPEGVQSPFSISEDISEHKVVAVTEFDEMENEIPFENRDGYWWRKPLQNSTFLIQIEIEAVSGKNLDFLIFKVEILRSKSDRHGL